MTQAALDSAYPPNSSQIAAAKAVGYVAWFGYFKFGNDGILNGWSDDDFRRVLAGGLRTAAYCSGFSDPLAVKARAAGLNIRPRLDVEAELRPDGAWVQAWLTASGAGLYGNAPVFTGRVARDYVLAAYPLSGDPGNQSWPNWVPRPTGGPCGWQWAGTHDFAGIGVDSSWLDDNFFTGGDMIFVLRHTSNGAEYLVDAAGKRPITAAVAAALDSAAKAGGQSGLIVIDADAALDQIPDALTAADRDLILQALAKITTPSPVPTKITGNITGTITGTLS